MLRLLRLLRTERQKMKLISKKKYEVNKQALISPSRPILALTLTKWLRIMEAENDEDPEEDHPESEEHPEESEEVPEENEEAVESEGVNLNQTIQIFSQIVI